MVYLVVFLNEIIILIFIDHLEWVFAHTMVMAIICIVIILICTYSTYTIRHLIITIDIIFFNLHHVVKKKIK